MATRNITIERTIKGTADLNPPNIQAKFELTMDADEDHERVRWAYFEKNYENHVTKRLEDQIKYFAVPLKSMQKEIDGFREEYNQIKKGSFSSLANHIKEAQKKMAQIQKKIREYNDYLAKAVQNIEKQQAPIWHMEIDQKAKKEAEKKIRKEIFWKKFRTVLKVVVVGTLVIAGAALAIAASIASFGALPAAIGVIGIVCAGIGGLSALAKTGLQIKNVWDLESKSLDKIRKDLSVLEVNLGKVSSKVDGLPKHLDDASRFHTLRQKKLEETNTQVIELDRQLKELNAKLSVLRGMNPLPKDVPKIEKTMKDMIKQKNDAVKVIKECMKRDEELNKLYEEARQLIGDLKKIPFTGPKSLGASLERHKNFDSLITAVDLLNGVAGNANTLKGALQ